MPEVTISIGGREYAVSCQEGEEHYLMSAAALLDTEATALTAQIGQLPEARMLLMAGLMLADKTAGADDQVKSLQSKAAALEAELNAQRSAPAQTEEVRVEVPVLPDGLFEQLTTLAERAEALAGQVEEKVSA